MLQRRKFLTLSGALLSVPFVAAGAARPFRLGLTPVFLDNDALVIEKLRAALEERLGGQVELEQRRTYKEVTEMLLDDALDAAWLCGFPYLQHKDELSVVGVPVWNGRPLYQSYLIVAPDDPATGLSDLEGGVHAFSDPDSNSGFLVTASDLAAKGLRPGTFFRRTFFNYGHRNVVRAVASGLARSGSVDGYVWQVLAEMEPELTSRTKVIYKSEWLGFPPVCVRTDRMQEGDIRAFAHAVLSFDQTANGRDALRLLQLDGMVAAAPDLFGGIAKRMQTYYALR